jgi:DMSO/TMAO reductase YedYZ molybdopterin-dependent catalytic subunit
MPISRISRRFFLILTGAFALLAALPGAVWARFIDFFPTRTVERGDFDFDPAAGEFIVDGAREPFRLVVDGLVESPRSLTYKALRELPQHRQVSDFHCVEGWSIADIAWSGIRVSEFVRLASPRAAAKWVILHSYGQTQQLSGGLDHYRECLPLADLLDERFDYLLALDKDDEPLSIDRGAPMRLVTPFDLAYKSIKFVVRIEFADTMVAGWWTLANPRYTVYAPVSVDRLRQKRPERTPYTLR